MGSISHTVGGSDNVVEFKSAARVPVTGTKFYFKPYQEGTGTPSPSNVRAISGWTGIEYSQDIDHSNLPIEYQRVEYLESDGNACINTKYIVSNSIGVECTYSTNSVVDSTNNKYGCIFGSRISSGNKDFQLTSYCSLASTMGAFRVGPSTEHAPKMVTGEKCTISFRNGVFTNNLGQTTTISTVDCVSNVPVYLFSLNQNHPSTTDAYIFQTGTGCKIYALKFYEGNTLARNYIPARYLADNVCGMYETVVGEFLVSGSSTQCTGGPDVGRRIPVTFYENLYAAPIKMQDTTLNTSGEETSEMDMQTTGYISVTEGSKYVIEYTSTYGARTRRIMGYDSSNNFVESLYSTSWATIGDTLTSTITIPSGVNKVKICMYSPDTGITFHAENPITVYGGYVDVAAGEIVGLWYKHTITGNETFYDDGSWALAFDLAGYSASNIESLRNVGYCTHYPYGAYERNKIGVMYNENTITFDGNIRDAAGWKAFCVAEYSNGTPIELCYPLKVPIHYPLTPTQLKTLLGQNCIWSNTNDVTEVSYAIHDSAPIRAAKHRIAANEPHIETVNGSMAHFSTDMKAPLKSCKVYFEPVQAGSGDPSPNNVRAISGWSGITIGNQSFNPGPYTAYTSNNGTYCDIKTGQTFKFEGTSEGLVLLNIYREDGSGIGSLRPMKNTNGVQWDTYTATEDIARFIFVNSQVTNGYVHMLNNTTEINWQTAAGTLYGGYVDLVSGEVWETWHKIIADGVNIKCNSSYLTDDIIAAGIVYLNPVGIHADYSEPNVFTDTISMYTQSYDNNHTIQLPYATCPNAGNQYIVFKLANRADHPEVIDSTTCKEFVNTWLQEHPTTIVYELATPTLITTLSPTALKTLRGQNNIWSNTNGNISVQYWTH